MLGLQDALVKSAMVSKKYRRFKVLVRHVSYDYRNV